MNYREDLRLDLNVNVEISPTGWFWSGNHELIRKFYNKDIRGDGLPVECLGYGETSEDPVRCGELFISDRRRCSIRAKKRELLSFGKALCSPARLSLFQVFTRGIYYWRIDLFETEMKRPPFLLSNFFGVHSYDRGEEVFVDLRDAIWAEEFRTIQCRMDGHLGCAVPGSCEFEFVTITGPDNFFAVKTRNINGGKEVLLLGKKMELLSQESYDQIIGL